MTYTNTNEKLYDDIALWEKTDGRDLFLEMPLKEKSAPKILDFGYGFGEQLFALTNAYYDALHATSNKYMLYEESHRILKAGGVLSILPVHLSNWRDRQGKKKTYTSKLIQAEIAEYGFSYAGTCTQKGVHWEKCHTLYYIKKGNITFDILEKVDVMNFVKK